MTPLSAVFYSFLFGLLHGVLPDEHTWPITFSYAIGGGSGREGMKAGLFFSAAFTVQRALLSEAAYLALAPFLLSSTINGVVYLVVGLAMTAAGALVLRQNLYPHFHLLGHHHEEAKEIETTRQVLTRQHTEPAGPTATLPVKWTLIHGFLAGFGFRRILAICQHGCCPCHAKPLVRVSTRTGLRAWNDDHACSYWILVWRFHALVPRTKGTGDKANWVTDRGKNTVFWWIVVRVVWGYDTFWIGPVFTR